MKEGNKRIVGTERERKRQDCKVGERQEKHERLETKKKTITYFLNASFLSLSSLVNLYNRNNDRKIKLSRTKIELN